MALLIFIFFDLSRAQQKSNKTTPKKPETDTENGVQKKNTEPESSVGTSRKKSLRSYANQETQQTSNGSMSTAEAGATTNNDNKPCSRYIRLI